MKSRICFPEGGYKPPKSRVAPKTESLSPQPPLVFKSPADIVKEVLLNIPDGSPASSGDCHRPPASAPNFTVPQDFRSRQQATVLLEQLQVNVEPLGISAQRKGNVVHTLVPMRLALSKQIRLV